MVRNTTEEAKNNPLKGFVDALNIPAAEARGQRELTQNPVVNVLPTEMPSRLGGGEPGTAFAQYAKMGIEVIKLLEDDQLFAMVRLPEGWSKRATSHSMWNDLLDNKGRRRGTFFYKAAFYDRDSFINFDRRYGYNCINWLPQEEKGHYKTEKVRVKIERDGRFFDEHIDMLSGIIYDSPRKGYRVEEQKTWVSKYKDSYEEDNNTPHYFEITDGGQIIYSTKEIPKFFKTKYKKENHQQWWHDYDVFKDEIKAEAIAYLDKHFPDWNSLDTYWD